MGAQLTPDDSVARLAEGLRRLYGEQACEWLSQFAAENARVGDALSAAYWDKIASIIANAEAQQMLSTGGIDVASH